MTKSELLDVVLQELDSYNARLLRLYINDHSPEEVVDSMLRTSHMSVEETVTLFPTWAPFLHVDMLARSGMAGLSESIEALQETPCGYFTYDFSEENAESARSMAARVLSGEQLSVRIRKDLRASVLESPQAKALAKCKLTAIDAFELPSHAKFLTVRVDAGDEWLIKNALGLVSVPIAHVEIAVEVASELVLLGAPLPSDTLANDYPLRRGSVVRIAAVVKDSSLTGGNVTYVDMGDVRDSYGYSANHIGREVSDAEYTVLATYVSNTGVAFVDIGLGTLDPQISLSLVREADVPVPGDEVMTDRGPGVVADVYTASAYGSPDVTVILDNYWEPRTYSLDRVTLTHRSGDLGRSDEPLLVGDVVSILHQTARSTNEYTRTDSVGKVPVVPTRSLWEVVEPVRGANMVALAPLTLPASGVAERIFVPLSRLRKIPKLSGRAVTPTDVASMLLAYAVDTGDTAYVGLLQPGAYVEELINSGGLTTQQCGILAKLTGVDDTWTHVWRAASYGGLSPRRYDRYGLVRCRVDFEGGHTSLVWLATVSLNDPVSITDVFSVV